MGNVIIFVAVLFVLIGATSTPLGVAISDFLLAGIVPGTNIQLPWYVSLLLAPLAIYVLSLLLVANISIIAKAQAAITSEPHDTKREIRRRFKRLKGSVAVMQNRARPVIDIVVASATKRRRKIADSAIEH